MTESSKLTAGEIPSERGVFCNRTLNLRAIRAIGYDLDYTLVHYQEREWEKRAYEYLKARLLAARWPVGELRFDPGMVIRGLVIDTELGNLVKTNRFGFVKRAMHGTRLLDFEAQRRIYSRVIVDLAERRWVFLNTLFSLSEGCMYAQLVNLLDRGSIPEILNYADLYERVKASLDAAHTEGQLKLEVMSDPERFVVQDADSVLALQDQRAAGKRTVLITNSDWQYAAAMMAHAFDRHLPAGTTWRGLFDIVIVGAGKPDFFTTERPFFEVDAQGTLQPATRGLEAGGLYAGGSVHELEKHLGLSGDEILYVGDHMFGDVRVTKVVIRWRTALILRELEEEIRAIAAFRPTEIRLAELMDEKEKLEAQQWQVRTELQRLQRGYGGGSERSLESLQSAAADLRPQLASLDEAIGPLARASTELGNPLWGPLMRAGNDKSQLAYQVERYADIYTSRVSNLLATTPFAYLRSPRGSLPHDPALFGGKPHLPRELFET